MFIGSSDAGKPTSLPITDELLFFPGAYIQFVRFDGETLADPVQDEKQVAGNLLTQLLQLDNLLSLQIRTARSLA